MLQRLTTALAQAEAGNTSEKLLNEIRKITYYLYREKEIAKKVYNNVMNQIKLWNRMDTIFMNSENNKASDHHRLSLNLSDKKKLKRSDKYVSLSNRSILCK